MKTLIKMTDYVKEQGEIGMEVQSISHQQLCRVNRFNKMVKYANFLSITLEVWQFVPSKLVDGAWVVLEEPKNYKQWLRKETNVPYDLDLSKYEEYQQAKERCYFEGFEVMNFSPQSQIITNKFINVFWYNSNEGWYLSNAFQTLEDLIPYNLNLTATAQKEIV